MGYSHKILTFLLKGGFCIVMTVDSPEVFHDIRIILSKKNIIASVPEVYISNVLNLKHNLLGISLQFTAWKVINNISLFIFYQLFMKID